MKEGAKILYVEDDETLGFITKDNLLENGYEIDHFSNGKDALKAFEKNYYDICLLDVMLPVMDGFTLAKEIRKLNHEVPILFLTAKSMKEDRIEGLSLGGDDYITKPFSIEELILKIEVFLRRKLIPLDEVTSFAFGRFQYDHKNLLLQKGDHSDKLTQKEGDLLKFLIENKNNIIKREEILKKLWGKNDYFLGRSMDVFISRLRKYLRQDESIDIENIHGVGFRLNIKD